MDSSIECEPHNWVFPERMSMHAPDKSHFVMPVGINRTERTIGWVPCTITQDLQPYHSSLERAFIELMEVTPGVTNLAMQPCVINYPTKQGIRRFIPDSVIELQHQKLVYVEIKPKLRLLSDENRERWAQIEEYLAKLGVHFRLYSEELLHSEPLKSNLRDLGLYRSFDGDLEINYLIDCELHKAGSLTLGQLQALHSDELLVRDCVYALIINRKLYTNIREPLTDQSLIQRVQDRVKH